MVSQGTVQFSLKGLQAISGHVTSRSQGDGVVTGCEASGLEASNLATSPPEAEVKVASTPRCGTVSWSFGYVLSPIFWGHRALLPPSLCYPQGSV